METPRITVGFSLASRLGNALALSLQSRGLKLKICSSKLGRFFYLIPDWPGRFIVEAPRITLGFSLASRLGNALALSLQSRGLKLKICSSKLGRFFYLIPGCARSLHRGDAENRTRVQTSSLKAFYIHSFCLILVL